MIDNDHSSSEENICAHGYGEKYRHNCSRCATAEVRSENAALREERDKERQARIDAEADYTECLNECSTLRAENVTLRKELNRRKGDPVTRLHNICEGIGEEADASAFSRGEWDRIDTENQDLRKEVKVLWEERDKWKASRIEYQTIVYNVCNILDPSPAAARRGKGVIISEVVERVRTIHARVKALEAVLKWYGDECNYRSLGTLHINDYGDPAFLPDRGHRARCILMEELDGKV